MAYTDYSAVQARNTADLAAFVNAAIADGWQPLASPTLAANGTLVQPLVKGTPSGGGGGGEVTAADITDATTVGRDVLTAADAAAARTAIGAGTSNLTIGTTASTAKAGDYTPPNAATGTRGLVLMGAAVADATDSNDIVDQFNALLASLRAAGSLSLSA
jgi:hypothetical protein